MVNCIFCVGRLLLRILIIYILFHYVAILTFFSINNNYLLLIFVSLLFIYYAYVLFACQVKNN